MSKISSWAQGSEAIDEYQSPNNVALFVCVCTIYLDILEGDRLLTMEFHLLLNGLKTQQYHHHHTLTQAGREPWKETYPEEVVEGKDVEVSLIVHVQKFENILQRCRLLPVLQGQYKV